MRAWVIKCGREYAGGIYQHDTLSRAILFRTKKEAQQEVDPLYDEVVVAVDIRLVKKKVKV